MYTPFFVQPGDSFIVKVRFAATVEDLRVYNGRIYIESDAMNESSFFIDLVGEIYEPAASADDEISLPLTVTVAPNPAQHQMLFTISNVINTAVNHSIYITDLLGNRITELHNGAIADNVLVIPFNSSKLANGLYYLVIENKNVRNVTRFVISK